MLSQSHHRLQIADGNAASHDKEPRVFILHLGPGKLSRTADPLM